MATTLQDAAAAAVAARGLMFANRTPAAHKWLPVKGPTASLPERAAAANTARLVASLHSQAAATLCPSGLGGSIAGCAAHLVPYMRQLAGSASHGWLHSLLPHTWTAVWQGALTERDTGSGAACAGPNEAILAAALGAATLGEEDEIDAIEEGDD